MDHANILLFQENVAAMIRSEANAFYDVASNIKAKQEAIWLMVQLLFFHLLSLNLNQLHYLIRTSDIAEIVQHTDGDFVDD